MVVNEDAFQITINLRQFFQQVRHPTIRQGPDWMNEICINQSNGIEKSTQISLMRHIYSTRRQGLMWLGPEADDSGMAYDLMKSAQKALEMHDKSASNNESSLQLKLSAARVYETFGLRLPVNDLVVLMRRFLENAEDPLSLHHLA